MTSVPVLGILILFVNAGAVAAAPQLYRQITHESPVGGAPDDLLLLAGSGLAVDDTVVYRAIRDTTIPSSAPDVIPTQSSADVGVAPIVSSADVPQSLTIKLPQIMRAHQSYRLWVRTAHGEWSQPVTINDARPLWVSPAYVYVSGNPASLPREIKIAGRNLQPSAGRSTQVRLIGPQSFTETALADAQLSPTMSDYVARVRLPERLVPGRYHVLVNRDGTSWVKLDGQTLEVLPDRPSRLEYRVGDPQFGGCRANDGADDTECIVRAIAAAARAGGGTVSFGAGTWDVIDSDQPGLVAHEGIVVPFGVDLEGAGSAVTRLDRHPEWNAHAASATFTLEGHTVVSGFTFRDLRVYQAGDQAGPYLQLGEDWQRNAPVGGVSAGASGVSEVVITRNVFDKPMVAIGSAGLPIDRLFITYNTFGAFNSALELTGDPYDMMEEFRIDDSVIDGNVFKPGSKLDLIHKTGTLVSELGAGHRVDFSGNTADGASTDYLYGPGDAKGWRAGFFWSTNSNVEEVLVSQNIATCTSDKIGDGEAIAFDSNLNTFALSSATTAVQASAGSVAVSAPFAARQRHRDVPAGYYVGHWVQIVSGPGLGEVRKIIGYTTDSLTHITTVRIAPDWDVVPAPGQSRIAIGREYWQLYVLDNQVDNRQPLCQKSNRSRRVGGAIEMWGQSADTVFAGNHQYDSDGIFVQQYYAFATQNYETSEHPCTDCTMVSFFNFFVEIRDNVVDGEFDWANDCSRSGIALGAAAAPWVGDGPPPTVGYGVSISHNTIRRADEEFGGAIAQVNTWFNGPEPQRWPLSDNVLIHHNAIADIDGPRALPVCGASRPRMGIAFPDPAIAWRTVLYANTCKNVSTRIGRGGIDTITVCPSSVHDSCECP